jgi:lipid II:glycine glycyltransferase (peptidoglycan interpeptide bridge formation enzyme)
VEVSLRFPREVGGRAVPEAGALDESLRRAGFLRTAEEGTYCVDLELDSDEALLARFSKNVRRDVRKALREGVIVDPSLDSSDFEGFARAYEAMGGRKGLEVHPPGFAREVLQPLAEKGQGDLFVARFGEEARNYVYVSCVGEPIYHWGALAEAGQEPGCPPTGQVTQYAAMCHYRSRGKRLYDLGGSPGPVPEPGHENYGVWRFKHAFGGPYVRYVGVWRRVLRPLRWKALDLARRLRSRRRP